MEAIKEILETINTIKKSGCLLSKEDIILLLDATKSITTHKSFINSLISLVTTLNLKQKKRINNLTKREIEILQYIGTGENSKYISSKLNLSISTVETHRKNIRKKLGIIGHGKLLEYAILYNIGIFHFNE